MTPSQRLSHPFCYIWEKRGREKRTKKGMHVGTRTSNIGCFRILLLLLPACGVPVTLDSDSQVHPRDLEMITTGKHNTQTLKIETSIRLLRSERKIFKGPGRSENSQWFRSRSPSHPRSSSATRWFPTSATPDPPPPPRSSAAHRRAQCPCWSFYACRCDDDAGGRVPPRRSQGSCKERLRKVMALLTGRQGEKGYCFRSWSVLGCSTTRFNRKLLNQGWKTWILSTSTLVLHD